MFDAPYQGDVYLIDAVTNNSGAAGGAVTDRRGRLIGLLGKELRNTLSNTWVNYAVPVQVLASFVDKAKRGEYKPVVRTQAAAGGGGYHGVILVPSVVDHTPPYVEDVIPGSPAAKAGLRADDLILNVEGQQILSVKAFRDFMGRIRPGQVIRIELRRSDRLLGGTDNLINVELKLEEPAAGRPSMDK
jgi:serine protease Do